MQKESENIPLVSERVGSMAVVVVVVCTQTEEITFSDNFTQNSALQDEAIEIYIEQYLQPSPLDEHNPKMPEQASQEYDDMEVKISAQWDLEHENWQEFARNELFLVMKRSVKMIGLATFYLHCRKSKQKYIRKSRSE